VVEAGVDRALERVEGGLALAGERVGAGHVVVGVRADGLLLALGEVGELALVRVDVVEELLVGRDRVLVFLGLELLVRLRLELGRLLRLGRELGLVVLRAEDARGPDEERDGDDGDRETHAASPEHGNQDSPGWSGRRASGRKTTTRSPERARRVSRVE